jgi:hypothetical protein
MEADMNNKILGDHRFNFTPQDNGGEALILRTIFYANGDPGIDGVFTNQELLLNSYSNSAAFNLTSADLTPKNLRLLADELERAMAEAASQV